VVVMTGNTRVPAGATVTLEAGAIVKSSGTTSLTVDGTLVARGLAGEPAIFTDAEDDSAGGDTNQNGPSGGYNGRWGRVRFTSTSGGSALDYVEFRYGGAGFPSQVAVEGAGVRFTRCVFRHSREDGLRMTSASAVVEQCKFHDNWGSAMSMDLASRPTVRGLDAGTNGVNGLSVDSGSLPADTAWDDPDVVYHPRGGVIVPAGRTLTLGPGQVIKLWGSSLTVGGTLRSLGTEAQPVVITSLRDDSAGGDTNNDRASSGYNGEWGRVEFLGTSSGNDLAYTEFRFGGGGSAAQVIVDNSPAGFTRCTFRHSRGDGLRMLGAATVVAGCSFHDNWASAMSMDLAANPMVTTPGLRANAVNGLSIEAGILPADGFWDDPDVVCHLKGNVTVPAGRHLTIAPGQVVKLWGSSLSVGGTLSAVGTAGRPIIITSLRDDSAGGDTNNDQASSGYNGEWGRVEFASTSRDNEIAQAEFRYGGAGSPAQVVVDRAPVALTRCTFRNSRVDGLRILGANPVVTRGLFHDNWASAMSMDLAANPVVSEPALRANAVNGLSVDAGTLPGDGFWDDPDVVYHLKGAITVPAGRRLGVAPRQIIKLWGSTLTVEGTLRAAGTATDPIVFTSLRDDSIGGDTSNDGLSSGYNGEWGRVEFTSTSLGNELAYAEFRYGGGGSAAQVLVEGASAAFLRCTFRHSRADGLRAVSCNPVVAQGQFHDNWGSAMSMDLAANPAVTGPELRANGVNGLSVDAGTLPADGRWDDPDVVYYLKGSIAVPPGRRLAIAPGQVVKLWGSTLAVGGALRARGTAARPIVLTSMRDDTIGGDTNNDQASSGYNGEWGRVEFAATSTENEVAHVEFRFGGGGSPGAVVFAGIQSSLEACLVRMSHSHGVVAGGGAQLTLTSSILCQNWGSGLRCEPGSVVNAFNCTLDGNDRGVWADAAAVTLVNDLVTANRAAGLTRSGGASYTVRHCNVHNPAAGVRNYDGLPALTGTDGNLSVETRFVDATRWSYALQPGSPAVDAGLGDGAPSLDFYEQGRVDDPQHANTGAGNPAFVDLGAVELDRWLSQVDTPRRGGQLLLGDTLRFLGTGRALDGTTRFHWDFGGEQSSALEDPGLVTIRSPGAKTVTFTAIGPDGAPDPNPARIELTVVDARGPLPDLEALEIQVPAQLAVGQPVDITYQVRNRGGAPLEAKSWVDSLYLSQDAFLDAADVRLASQTLSYPVPAGGTYSNTLRVAFDPGQMHVGVLHLVLSVDDEWALLEERQLNNERALAVDLAIPELLPGVARPAQFARGGAGHFYRFAVAEGENLRLLLDDANDQGINELYLRRGALPSREAYDERLTAAAGADQELIVAAPAPGTWYLLAVGARVPDAGDYVMRMDQAALTLGTVFPNRGGQVDGAPFRLRGAGFVPGTRVDLVDISGNIQAAAAVTVVSFSQLEAKLNLSGVAPGSYGLRVEAGGATAKLDNALTVVAGGQARLETRLIVPEVVGYHQLATLYVEYRNAGTAPMPAPLIAVSGLQKGQRRALLTLDAARVTTGLWVSGLPGGFSHTAQFLAGGEIPGWLHPGESGKVPVYYAGWLQPWDLSYPPIEFNLAATTTESQMPIDWGEFNASMKPGAISTEAWTIVSANLQKELGSTWGTLMSALSEDAACLGRIVREVSDAVALLGFELAQADGGYPFSRIEREVDAVAQTPGLPLVFERAFPALVSARFEMGPLGRGWKHSWETGLKVLDDGSVVLRTRGCGVHIFQPDLRGGYISQPGDYGNLTRSADGRYRLLDPDGITSVFFSDGRLEWVGEANGHRITLEYAGTQLARLRHSGGSAFEFSYSPAGRLQRLTDERGDAISFTYDAAEEHLLRVQYPRGRSVTYRYGATGAQTHALLERLDTNGSAHHYTYDDRGRVVTVRFGGDQPELTLEYGPGGEVSLVSGGTGARFYFDHEGRLLRTRDARGLIRQASYDSQGRLVEMMDPLGRVTSARYDNRGNVLSVTDILGRTTGFGYNAAGRLATVTDPKGQSVGYDYDPRGNLVRVTQPDASAEQYARDTAGRLAEWTRPNGAKLRFTYNASGRVERIVGEDGTQYAYEYDPRGNLVSTTDTRGTTRYTLDGNSRVTRVDLPGGRFLQFTYDRQGRRASMADQTGFTVLYHYGEAGRLQRLTDAQGKSLVEYRYASGGRLERIDKGNGTFTVYGRDTSGRLNAITNSATDGTVLSRFDWVYDDFGRISSRDSHQGRWTYSYDSLGQLSGAQFVSSTPELPDQDLRFEYDAAGNRTRTVSRGLESTYTANSLNQYTQTGEARMTYDALGGLATRTEGSRTWKYSYDAVGRVTRVEAPEGTWRYEYDALGNRVAAVRGDQRREFVYDPLSPGNLVGEYAASGALEAHYAHGLGLVGRFDPSGRAQFYDFDHIGSTVGMTSLAGTYENEYAFSPFGEVLGARETVANPFQFVGQHGVTCDGSGLYHMQARDYLPGLGRFISRDPFGQRASPNLYTYAANNPVSIIDPSGADEDFPGVGVFLDSQNGTLYIFRNAYERGWGRFFDAMREAGFMTDEAEGYLERGWQSFDAVLELQNLVNWAREPVENAFNTVRDGLGDLWISLVSREEEFEEWAGNAWTGLRNDLSNWYSREVPRRYEQIVNWLSAMMSRVRPWVDDALEWVGNTWNSSVAGVLDPNEKTAPAGGGTNHFVPADGWLTYRIDFENDARATAPAQYVSIVDDLHPDLDWATFELAEIAFGDQFVPVTPGTRNFLASQSITYLSRELLVEVRAELDLESGRLQVVFSTTDPATGLPPAVLLGFLPPEDGTGRGQGHVTYRIRPKAGLPSGTQISNVARITFDFTETIATDQVDPHDPGKGTDPAKQARNTLDSAAPVSRVLPLPETSSPPGFTVTWEAADEVNGTGISGVDVFVSTNGGVWTLWLEKATNSSAVFPGSPGNRFAFFSVARDHAGHVETMPESADASTRVAGVTAVQLRHLSASPPGTLTLSWPSLSEGRYTLLYANDLNGPWQVVPGQESLPGTGGEMRYSAPASAAAAFYRLGDSPRRP
jgi:RHS repeat-associated protein